MSLQLEPSENRECEIQTAVWNPSPSKNQSIKVTVFNLQQSVVRSQSVKTWLQVKGQCGELPGMYFHLKLSDQRKNQT